MPYPIEQKLVIAVSSSALFDMQESDAIFRQDGEKAYREYQRKNIDVPLRTGVAFPFIKRLLSLNNAFPKECPVEVILFSKNSPETGLRALRVKYLSGMLLFRQFQSSIPSSLQFYSLFDY